MRTLSYRHIYLVPHLDDAVLSCGGLIHRQTEAGEPVLVITVFAGSPSCPELSVFATYLYHAWNLGTNPMEGRRMEDQRALAFLGAEYRHLEHMDCIYRSAPDGGGWLYPMRDDIFGDVHPTELDYGRALARDLGPALPLAGGTTLYAPLGIGHHVDHQIVRQAACILRRDGYEVRFFEDYPYSAGAGELEGALRDAPGSNWSSKLEMLSSEDMEAKIAAISRYTSQLDLLFGGLTEMRRKTIEFFSSLGTGGGYAERYWQLGEERS